MSRRKERKYPVTVHYPTEGTLTVRQIERSLEGLRDIWESWLEIVTQKGPTATDAQQMLVRVGTQIQHLEVMRSVYFSYPPEDESSVECEHDWPIVTASGDSCLLGCGAQRGGSVE